MSDEEKKKPINMEKPLRVFGIFFIALAALGLSTMVGDAADTLWVVDGGRVLSSFSITSTVFGIIGFIICEINARRAAKW